MKKMICAKMKRLLGVLLLPGLLLSMLTGCGGKNGAGTTEDANTAGAAMGRYVEQQLASVDGASQVMGLYLNADGDLVFYTSIGGSTALTRCVLSPDSGKLIQTPVAGTESLGYILDVSEAADGTTYLAASDENMREGVYRLVNGAAEAIPVPELAQEASSRHVLGIRSLSGGDFLLLFGGDGVSHYQGSDAALLTEYPVIGYNWSVGVYDGKFIAPGIGSDELVAYDLHSGEQIHNVTFDGLSASSCQGMDGTGLYLADTTGIYRLTQGDDGWERLVDGDLTSLSLYSVMIGGVTSDGRDGFFTALSGENGLQLMRYVDDASIPAVPDTTLTVFSLTDNSTIRQAIGTFHRQNPNVRVQFQIMLDDDSSAGAEDVIRTLNTELLNGNGPDILLLDGLPIKSYMEKGVLADLTEQVSALAEDGFMVNLASAYEYEGRCYGVPSRFTIPVMLGAEEILGSIRSLDDLVTRVEAEQTGELPFLRPSDYLFGDGGMLMDCYDACSSGFVGTEGIDEASLANYLSAMLRLQRSQEDFLSTAAGDVTGGTMELFELMGVSVMPLGDSEELFYAQELPGQNAVNIIPAGQDGETGGEIGSALEPLFGGGSYAPKWSVGITSASEQQELARQFIDLLLSAEVQDVYLYDGFPVNSQSLDKMVENAVRVRGSDMGLKAMFDRMDTPILVDQVVKEAVQSQLRGLLDGSLTPEAAASAVMESTKLYLME